MLDESRAAQEEHSRISEQQKQAFNDDKKQKETWNKKNKNIEVWEIRNPIHDKTIKQWRINKKENNSKQLNIEH